MTDTIRLFLCTRDDSCIMRMYMEKFQQRALPGATLAEVKAHVWRNLLLFSQKNARFSAMVETVYVQDNIQPAPGNIVEFQFGSRREAQEFCDSLSTYANSSTPVFDFNDPTRLAPVLMSENLRKNPPVQ